jgi:hypothetical protein
MSMAVEYPNWFAQAAQYNFEAYLTEYAGKDNLRFLQLGVYTGDASVWICENILTGKYCELQDVDTWQGSDEEAHKSINFEDVRQYYYSRTKGMPIVPFTKTTTDHLITIRKYYKYDFIYIDADHTTVGVLLDAELSWPLLKSGGIMAFDDYEWGSHLPLHLRAKPGIDLFLLRHEGQYDTLVKNNQYWIRKH